MELLAPSLQFMLAMTRLTNSSDGAAAARRISRAKGLPLPGNSNAISKEDNKLQWHLPRQRTSISSLPHPCSLTCSAPSSCCTAWPMMSSILPRPFCEATVTSWITALSSSPTCSALLGPSMMSQGDCETSRAYLQYLAHHTIQ